MLLELEKCGSIIDLPTVLYREANSTRSMTISQINFLLHTTSQLTTIQEKLMPSVNGLCLTHLFFILKQVPSTGNAEAH